MIWSDIFLVGAAGIFSSALTQIITYLIAKMKSQQKKRYAALRLSVILENFAIDCADRVSEISNAISSGGIIGKVHFTLPDIPDYPSKINWELLSLPLIDDVLSFPREIAIRNGIINFVFEQDNKIDAAEACAEHCALQGVRAYNIASNFRKKNNLGEAYCTSKIWDWPTYLQQKVDKYSEQKEKREQVKKKLLQKLSFDDSSQEVK